MTDENEVQQVEESANNTAESNGLNFRWFVVQALTGQENKVQKTLKERIVNYKLSEFFQDIIVPEEEVITNVNGKPRKMKKKLFPGYVLVRMVLNDTTWHLVMGTDKISGFIGGTRDKPEPITDEEAARMLNLQLDTQDRPRTNVNFSEGDQVKVIEGPFATFVGTIEAVNENGKIRVSVSIFGRPTPVELDFTQVERVG